MSCIKALGIVFVSLLGFMVFGNAHASEAEVSTEDAKMAGIITEADCFTWELIIGEGEHEGQIELVGCPAEHTIYSPLSQEVVKREGGATRSVLLEGPDEHGRYYIPLTQKEIDQGRKSSAESEISFSLGSVGEPPMFRGEENGEVKITRPLYPVYDASQDVKDGKLTPFIAPDILPPAIVVSRKTGRIVGTGYVWSILTRKVQLLGD